MLASIGLMGFLFSIINIVLSLSTSCKVSEFACKTICIPLDKFCDGKEDCADGHDEPKHCTVCNRTYYGDLGRTYSISVPAPQWNMLPFLCHLTFTASGHDQGDIVQIIFDGFSVGKFDEGQLEIDAANFDASIGPAGELPGCPEGYMQLIELGRPFTGGSWCGKATGAQIYFSETSTVTASVKVFRPPKISLNETPFQFRIRYKFLSQMDAVVRYGFPEQLLELGRVTPGTYCTRHFDDCFRNKCRLQSPNYPGMYPRNVSCYWTIRQKGIPASKHAMIAVYQDNQYKALVKRSIASFNKTSRLIRAWADCKGERDHLIFYDGSSTNDPVLAKYCGGDWLPRVMSRGHEMLVAFHSSPFSAPLQQGISNRGFELDVDVLYTDSDSFDYIHGGKHTCEFYINATNPDEVLLSRKGRMGRLVSPRHTLSPNVTCTYYFIGYPGDLIWIYFTSYNLKILQQSVNENNTQGRTDLPPWITRLRLWDSFGSLPSPKTAGGFDSQWLSTSADEKMVLNNAGNDRNYYREVHTKLDRNLTLNVDTAWNPVDKSFNNATQTIIFGRQHIHKFSRRKREPYSLPLSDNQSAVAILSHNTDIKTSRASINYLKSKLQEGHLLKSNPEKLHESGSKPNSQIIFEIYDYEKPKLCDHNAMHHAMQGLHRLRPCSLLESYISSGSDLKLEFHTFTGTALFPAQFAFNYEFVDTEQGGDPWIGRRGGVAVPQLCSRVFHRRKGNIKVPRNVFLYGRGGAKNLSCLYRFEASYSERVRLVLHNVSFGEGSTCFTDTYIHSGRPRCNRLDPSRGIRELRLYDIPFRDIRLQLGCFCDNTSSIYNTDPPIFVSNSRIMELTFTVSNLNISEDFGDVYFFASYEFKRVSECQKRLKLKGFGGGDDIRYPMKSIEASCEEQAWYIEPQSPDHSIFVQTWGNYMPVDPHSEDAVHCPTKNRIIVYSGKPLKIMSVICPAQSGTKPSPLYIFTDAWIKGQPTYTNRSVGVVLEPILKEPGHISFTWLEIHRSKKQFFQHLEKAFNVTGDSTTLTMRNGTEHQEYTSNFYPYELECEHKCPEIDACISPSLWCDGKIHCPSGIDESEDECGTARKLIELPGGIFGALGCILAALMACVVFFIFGLLQKRKKLVSQETMTDAGTFKQELTKNSLLVDSVS